MASHQQGPCLYAGYENCRIKILETFYDLFPRKQWIHLHDNGSLNMKSDSRVRQQTLKHQALAGTEINFTISHNHNINKILESDWLPERTTFNQIFRCLTR